MAGNITGYFYSSCCIDLFGIIKISFFLNVLYALTKSFARSKHFKAKSTLFTIFSKSAYVYNCKATLSAKSASSLIITSTGSLIFCRNNV